MSSNALHPFKAFRPTAEPSFYRTTNSNAGPGADRFQVAWIGRLFNEYSASHTLFEYGDGATTGYSVTISGGNQSISFAGVINTVLAGQQAFVFSDLPRSFLTGQFMTLLFDFNIPGNTVTLWINGHRHNSDSVGGASTYSRPAGSFLSWGTAADDTAAVNTAQQALAYAEDAATDDDIINSMMDWMVNGDIQNTESAVVPFLNRWSVRKSGMGGLLATLPDLEESIATPVNGMARTGTPLQYSFPYGWVGYSTNVPA